MGPDVIVTIDGEVVGVTGADGTLTAETPAGAVKVRAVLPRLAEGSVEINVSAGDSVAVDVPIDDSYAVEPVDVTVQGLVNGAFPTTGVDFGMRLSSAGREVTPVEILQILVGHPDSDFRNDFSLRFFEIDAEVISAASTVQLLDAFRPKQRAVLDVMVRGDDGLVYEGSASIGIGTYEVLGRVVASSHASDLSVTNLSVMARLNNDQTVEIRTDAQGQFVLKDVPPGELDLDVQDATTGAASYDGMAFLEVTEDTSVLIRLLGVEDVVDLTAPWESPDPIYSPPGSDATRSERERVADDPDSRPDSTFFTPRQRAAVVEPFEAASVYVSSVGKGGVPQRSRASFEVPALTSVISLAYSVNSTNTGSTADAYSLALYTASGERLLSVGGRASSTLGTFSRQVLIDVSRITSRGPVVFVLAAVAVDAFDYYLGLILSADAGTGPTFQIDQVVPDTVSPTKGNSDRYSIPRPSGPNTRNHFHREFTIRWSGDPNIVVSKAEVELLGGSFALATVVNEPPGGPKVRVGSTAHHLIVRVTFGPDSSSVPSQPPIHDRIRYRFRVIGMLNGQTLTTQWVESTDRHALWRMPDGLPRYGYRDPGRDDWTHHKTYAWLMANPTLRQQIDDISGEHARDLKHTTHFTGSAIDMYHAPAVFGQPPIPGAEYYSRLAAAVQDVLAGDVAQLPSVATWVGESRTFLSSLLANTDVRQVIYAEGADHPATPSRPVGLTAGWARDLLRTGVHVTPNGATIDINTPPGAVLWADANDPSMLYNGEHNSHIHVQLNW